MLWLCSYKALPGVRCGALGHRFLRQHDAGTNVPGALRGWYELSNGVDGIVLIEAELVSDVSAMVEPYTSLVHWDIEPVTEVNYNQLAEELRRSGLRRAQDAQMAGTLPRAVE